VAKVIQPQQRKQSLIICGVPEDTSKEQIAAAIKKTVVNEKPEIIIEKLFADKNDRQYAIVTLTIIEAQRILTKGKLLINFITCQVKPYHKLKRCFKCQQIGHLSYDHKNKTMCGKCGEEHDTRKCSSEIKKCVNCTQENKNTETTYQRTIVPSTLNAQHIEIESTK
ncbi:hypothetical protein CEXT_688631, partial [Caerostris extrusa]